MTRQVAIEAGKDAVMIEVGYLDDVDRAVGNVLVKKSSGVTIRHASGNPEKTTSDEITPLRTIKKGADVWPVIQHFLKMSGRSRRLRDIVAHLKVAGYTSKTPSHSVNSVLKTRMNKGIVRRVPGKRGHYELIAT